MRDFYGTTIEIWAGFGPIGSTEKKGLGQLRATFEGGFFYVFRGQTNVEIFFRKHCSVSTKKLHKMQMKVKFLFT